MKMRKSYLNHRTEETTASASQAIKWHRAGDLVQVNTYYNEPGKKTGLANVVHVPGAAQEPERSRGDENWNHCRRIAEELESYIDGNVRRCPECGEIHYRDWDEVGDVFRCPHCGSVADTWNWETLGMWDFLDDVYDVEFRCSSRREFRSVRVMVACGGPNIYLDSGSRDVELYWWNERSRYPLSDEAADALESWAEEYWKM